MRWRLAYLPLSIVTWGMKLRLIFVVVKKIEINSRKVHKEKTLRLQSVEIMNSMLCEPSEKLTKLCQGFEP